jgi:hypothetical protein
MEEILKYRLIEEIIATNDIVILDQIKSLLTGEHGDFWDNLDADSQKSIERGLKDVELGKTESHESIMEKYKSRFTK